MTAGSQPSPQSIDKRHVIIQATWLDANDLAGCIFPQRSDNGPVIVLRNYQPYNGGEIEITSTADQCYGRNVHSIWGDV